MPSARPTTPTPVLSAAGFVLLMTFVLISAAMAAPPVPDACDQQDSGERIKCRFNNIVVQQRAAAQMISTHPNVPAGHKDALMKQVERAGRAQGKATPADYKQLTRKAKPACQILEIAGDGMGDDDGVCTGNEDCAEVIGDQIGNDDGICRPRNGRNRETCVEICDEEAINADAANFDDDPALPSLGRDVEEELDGITGQYVELNQALEQDTQLRAAAGILSAHGDPCATVFAARTNTNVLAVIVGVATGLRVGADIAERFCDQSVFGTNTAAVCAVIEGIAGAGAITSTAFMFGDSVTDSDTLDATFGCIQNIQSSVGAVQTTLNSVQTSVGGGNQALVAIQAQMTAFQQQIDAVQSRLDVLRQQVDEVNSQVLEVNRLVNTPQGRRDEFPGGTEPVPRSDPER
jgi:hypothetical protein